MLEFLANNVYIKLELADLRYRGAELYRARNRVVFNFSFPVKLSQIQHDRLTELVKAQEFGGYTFEINVVRDEVRGDDIRILAVDVLKRDFFVLYKRFHDTLRVEKWTEKDAFEQEHTVYFIIFKTDVETYGIIEQTGVLQALEGFFAEYTVTEVKTQTEVFSEKVDLNEAIAQIERRQDLLQLDVLGKPSRCVEIENVTALIGKAVVGKPIFIIDVNKEEAKISVCGKVKRISKVKPKNTESKVKWVCKFALEDFTGELAAVYFSRSDDKFDELQEGDEVVVFGRTSADIGELQIIVSNISRCTIVKDKNVNVIDREPNDKYISVFPETYVNPVQQEFGAGEEATPECLSDRDFVVFDLETTGLKPVLDKIIEIGAIKIHNGKITEYFHTLVNPDCHIPAEASAINHITDDMVVDAPRITHIIGDFYKFAYGAALVSHNIDFDYGFLRYFALPVGYSFNNPKIDTIDLSKRFFATNTLFPRPRDNRLRSVAAALGIKQVEAHRGLDDSRVAAEILIKIAQFSPDTLENCLKNT